MMNLKVFLISLLFVFIGVLFMYLTGFIYHRFTIIKSMAADNTVSMVNESPAVPILLANNIKEVFIAGTNGIYNNKIVDTNFGVYAMQPLGNELYLGVSGGPPGGTDGSLMIRYKDGELSPVTNLGNVNPISEQGILDMETDGVKIYIPGDDPVEPGDPEGEWSKGNWYEYTPGGEIIKHRDLENVIHGLGWWKEGNTIYISTGAHMGDNSTWDGRIYRSEDNGNTWQYFQFSNYRVWDIIRYKGILYSHGTELVEGKEFNVFKRSLDNGQTWEKLGTYFGSLYHRMFEYQGLLVNNTGYYAPQVFDGTNPIESKPLPSGFHTQHFYNTYAVGGDGYLYLTAYSGNGLNNQYYILRTNNFTDYYLVANQIQQPISLSYWPEKNMVVFTGRKFEGDLWGIDISQITALPLVTPIPVPTVAPTATPTWYQPAPITPVVSKEGKIVLAGNGPVSIVNPDGTNKQVFISSGEIGDYYPSDASWSVDRKEMALVIRKYNSSDFSYNYRLLTKSYPDGVYEEWLPPQAKNVSITHPHLSPDGREMYFSMNEGIQDFYGIYKVKKGEKQAIPIIPAPAIGKYLLGDVSPDGSEILYYFGGDGTNSQSEDIFIANIDGSNPVDLTNTPGYQELDPTFSGDGRQVLYYEYNAANGTYDLSVMDIETKVKRFLNPSADVDEGHGCFSPDGLEIVYSGRTKAIPNVDSVYRINADGTGITKIISPLTNVWLNMHCWAPDPTYIEITPTPKMAAGWNTNVNANIVNAFCPVTSLKSPTWKTKLLEYGLTSFSSGETGKFYYWCKEGI